MCRSNNKGSKEHKQGAAANSVVFIFKQFELMPKETIECFVSLISCHVDKLSIFFMFELATQSNVIYEQLSSNCVAKLCLNKLYTMSPSQYLEKFFRQVSKFIHSKITILKTHFQLYWVGTKVT